MGAEVKFIESKGDVPHYIELSRRNLETLLLKLDDPLSHRTLMSPCSEIVVTAVENERHYKSREPGPIYMPTSGETL